MKNVLRLLLLLGLSGSFFLAGCSVRVYGVSKEEWQQMTPAEQQQIREAYLERRRLYEERRLYEAKQRAHEAELRAMEAREAASRLPEQHERDGAPALIHFMLEGGTVYVAGRHRPYKPVTVALRQGESKRLVLVTTDEPKPYHVQLVCSYENGTLWLSSGKSRIHAQSISYDRRWHQGQRYQNLKVGGAVGLRGGMVRVGTGSMPAVSDLRHSASPQTGHPDKASRSGADKGGERLHQHERGKADCHNDRQRMSKPGQGQECRVQDQDVHQGKPAPVPQASSSNHKRQVSGTSGGNTSVKPTQHQHANAIAAAAAQAREKLNTANKKSQNGNKQEPNPRQVGIPHDDKSPRQRGAPSTDNKEVGKEKRKVDEPGGDACYEDIAGSKKMHGECDAETVMDKAQGKRN